MVCWALRGKGKLRLLLQYSKEYKRNRLGYPSLPVSDFDLLYLQYIVEVDCRKFAACLNSVKGAQHRVSQVQRQVVVIKPSQHACNDHAAGAVHLDNFTNQFPGYDGLRAQRFQHGSKPDKWAGMRGSKSHPSVGRNTPSNYFLPVMSLLTPETYQSPVPKAVLIAALFQQGVPLIGSTRQCSDLETAAQVAFPIDDDGAAIDKIQSVEIVPSDILDNTSVRNQPPLIFDPLKFVAIDCISDEGDFKRALHSARVFTSPFKYKLPNLTISITHSS